MAEEVTISPSEMLVKVFDDFAESEPKAIMVIFTDHAGNFCRISSSDSISTQLGLIEFARHMIHRRIDEVGD